MSEVLQFDKLERQIINALQGGFPIVDEPFKKLAEQFDVPQGILLDKISTLLESGALSRFGPLFNPESMGGAVTLAAMSVPDERYEEVTGLVNKHREVAHNYAREHALNMWFVVSSETPEEVGHILEIIADESGLEVYNCPKEKEFFIGLRLEL